MAKVTVHFSNGGKEKFYLFDSVARKLIKQVLEAWSTVSFKYIHLNNKESIYSFKDIKKVDVVYQNDDIN